MNEARRNAFAAISSERDYQDTKWVGHRHEVGAYLTMLRTYLHEAEEAWTRSSGDEEALKGIRKIGGIAVACMEEHGAPMRELHIFPTGGL